jgi:serine/threonine-protein kinase
MQREALVGRDISNRHLAPVVATSLIRAPQYIVFPWLEGASLDARIRAGQQFDAPRVLWIARQAAEALDALHAAGWMHGDVSPGNIHVSPSGHVTLIDLSFARRRDEIGSAVDRPIMGTCAYLAPEYLTSALRSDMRSDIYSLGAVMFEMFSGRPPYRADSLAELADQQRHAAPPDLVRLAPHVPREVARLVRRMLAHDPLRRPQSPRELVEQLVALEVATFTQRPW